MPTLDFDVDWADPDGVRGAELAATWATLRIRVGDSVITRVLDERTRTTREFLFLPLYPLAEWFAANWWFLTHEFLNPDKSTDADFRGRHSLVTGRQGYALPNVEFVSCGSVTRLAWKAESPPWLKVNFLEQGEAWVDTTELRASCARLVECVIGRLSALGIENTFLQEEWAAIQTADEQETAFCETSAGLGWDPYSLDAEQREWIIWLDKRLGDLKLGNVISEIVPVMATPDDYEEWRDFARALSEAKKFNRIQLGRLKLSDRDDFWKTVKRKYPWDVGHAAARQLRRILDVDQTDPLPTLSAIAQALQINVGSIEKVTECQEAFVWPGMVDAVVAQDLEAPAFAFRRPRKHEDTRRFQFCRALAEVLLSPGCDALLTKAHTERQVRNRAFATEFLAPSNGLRHRVRRKVVDDDDMNELAVAYGVSPRLIERQIRDHRIADIWEG